MCRFLENQITSHMLRKTILILFFMLYSLLHTSTYKAFSVVSQTVSNTCPSDVMYTSMQLDGVVSRRAFRQAVQGYEKIEGRQRNVLTLIDFTRPSTEPRLFVFDMNEHKLIYSSLVAHGRNSGGNYATSFSNKEGSFQSSLGFYLTSDTYTGKNGYSLVLDGLEKGINDNARSRAIVVHGAHYANPSVVQAGGRLGRSLGCPALPQKVSRTIIDAIKGGSVMYVYADRQEYLSSSTILSPDVSTL